LRGSVFVVAIIGESPTAALRVQNSTAVEVRCGDCFVWSTAVLPEEEKSGEIAPV